MNLINKKKNYDGIFLFLKVRHNNSILNIGHNYEKSVKIKVDMDD